MGRWENTWVKKLVLKSLNAIQYKFIKTKNSNKEST